MVPWNSVRHEEMLFAILEGGLVKAKDKGRILEHWPAGGEVPTLRALGDQLSKLIKTNRPRGLAQIAGQRSDVAKTTPTKRSATIPKVPSTPVNTPLGLDHDNSPMSSLSSSWQTLQPDIAPFYHSQQSVVDTESDHITVSYSHLLGSDQMAHQDYATLNGKAALREECQEPANKKRRNTKTTAQLPSSDSDVSDYSPDVDEEEDFDHDFEC